MSRSIIPGNYTKEQLMSMVVFSPEAIKTMEDNPPGAKFTPSYRFESGRIVVESVELADENSGRDDTKS